MTLLASAAQPRADAAIDRYLLPAGPAAANPSQRGRQTEQKDERTDTVASELWGQRGGVHCTPPSSGLVPPVPPQVKDAAYVKILSRRL